MRDRTILHIITLLGVSGWSLLFRKGKLKDWVIVYLFKTLISTLMDVPAVKRKYVVYPKRYLPNAFDSNISFLYIIFPISCVVYNQFTYKMKPVKTMFSVLLFSIPMTAVEYVLEKKTGLVKYRKGWNSLHTFGLLTVSFWIVRIFVAGIRYLDNETR